MCRRTDGPPDHWTLTHRPKCTIATRFLGDLTFLANYHPLRKYIRVTSEQLDAFGHHQVLNGLTPFDDVPRYLRRHACLTETELSIALIGVLPMALTQLSRIEPNCVKCVAQKHCSDLSITNQAAARKSCNFYGITLYSVEIVRSHHREELFSSLSTSEHHISPT
jgi:hypothetical protein